jgi:hypothetical protein
MAGGYMDWIQVITIIGVNAALIGTMTTMLLWAINKMDADIKSTNGRLDGHAQRIDQLYKMFVDLLQTFKK